MLTNDDMRNILRHRIDAVGDASKWCRENGVDTGYISKALAGKDPVGGRTLEILGYQRKVVFVPLQQPSKVQ